MKFFKLIMAMGLCIGISVYGAASSSSSSSTEVKRVAEPTALTKAEKLENALMENAELKKKFEEAHSRYLKADIVAIEALFKSVQAIGTEEAEAWKNAYLVSRKLADEARVEYLRASDEFLRSGKKVFEMRLAK